VKRRYRKLGIGQKPHSGKRTYQALAQFVRSGLSQLTAVTGFEVRCPHMKAVNSFLLVVAIILAFIPSILVELPDRVWISRYDDLPFVMGFVWLAVAIVYYRRRRTVPSAWIFALAPVAFWPLVFFLLLYIGVLLSHGNF
jgi:hypothetical protein